MHALVGVFRMIIVRMTTILNEKQRYMSSLSKANSHNKLKFHFQEKHVCGQQSGNFQIKLFGCLKLMKFYVFCACVCVLTKWIQWHACETSLFFAIIIADMWFFFVWKQPIERTYISINCFHFCSINLCYHHQGMNDKSPSHGIDTMLCAYICALCKRNNNKNRINRNACMDNKSLFKS